MLVPVSRVITVVRGTVQDVLVDRLGFQEDVGQLVDGLADLADLALDRRDRLPEVEAQAGTGPV